MTTPKPSSPANGSAPRRSRKHKAVPQRSSSPFRAEDALRQALEWMIGRAQYVLAHRYGVSDPVGTRLIALGDLRAEMERSIATLKAHPARNAKLTSGTGEAAA